MTNCIKVLRSKTLLATILTVVLYSTSGLNPVNGQTLMATHNTTAWIAPSTTNTLKNPFKGNSAATAEGQKLFKQFCVICHGEKGKGDGMAGVALKPRPANFTKSSVQSQTDGAIFWKMTEGRTPMASYKDALTETQRWQLVNYIRQLGKQQNSKIR